MNVLVTGATGFIGNHLIEELLKRGIAVVATSSNIEKATHFSWFNKVKYIEFDFNNLNENENYFTFFQSPDALIHLAWQGLPNYTSDFHLKVNLPLQKLFLSNLIDNGLKDITVTGTCFEYGMQEGCLSENMECKPDNAYAKAKFELYGFLQLLPIKLKWIRLFYMYGKGQSEKSILSLLQKAIDEKQTVFNMSGGQQERDYLPIEKVVDYIANIALQNDILDILNCCSGEPIKIIDLVHQYLQSTHSSIKLNVGFYPYAAYEPMRFWGNNEKLKMLK